MIGGQLPKARKSCFRELSPSIILPCRQELSDFLTLRSLFLMFIHNPCLIGSGGDIDETYEQRNFIVLVQAGPHQVAKGIDISFDIHASGFSFEAGKIVSLVSIILLSEET